MRVLMNFRAVRGPYGGANAFLRTLRAALERRGLTVVTDPGAAYDVALLNALTEDIDLAYVARVADRAPVVHRKVGYRVSGSPEMRRVEDGVVHGDRLQLEFAPYVAHTIFQSAYSRDVFVAAGHDGPYTIVHNGVDESVFNLLVRPRSWQRPRVRSFWDGRSPLRVVVSTWSTDENKGFADYRRIGEALHGDPSVRLTLVGRAPGGASLPGFRLVGAKRRRPLAAELKRHHVLLQLARFETCSNALIEGINCGLPAVYLDSGSNAELASGYGVPYEGDLPEALTRLAPRYDEFVAAIPQNPFRSELVADRYLELLERAVS
jgi:hypothetical protein